MPECGIYVSGLFKGKFTTAQVGEDEAPQARGSRRRGGRGVWGGEAAQTLI